MAPRYDSTGRRWESVSMHTASDTEDSASTASFETARGREQGPPPAPSSTASFLTAGTPDESVRTPSCAPTTRPRQQSNPYRIVFEGSPPPQVRRGSRYSVTQGDLDGRSYSSAASHVPQTASSASHNSYPMWTCARCIERNPVTNKFCSDCEGLRIEMKKASELSSSASRSSAHTEPTARKWKCNQCEQRNSIADKYCSVCNTPQTDRPKSFSQNSKRTSRAPSVSSTATFDHPMPTSSEPCALHGRRHCTRSTCRSPPSVASSSTTGSPSSSSGSFHTARTHAPSEASNTSTVCALPPDPDTLRPGLGMNPLRTASMISMALASLANRRWTRKDDLSHLRFHHAPTVPPVLVITALFVDHACQIKAPGFTQMPVTFATTPHWGLV